MIERLQRTVMQDGRTNPVESLATGTTRRIFAQFIGEMGQLWQWCLFEPIGLEQIRSGQVNATVEIGLVTAICPRVRIVDQREIPTEEVDIRLR